MKRHIKGEISGKGNFTEISAEKLNVRVLTGPIADEIKSLKDEIEVLKNIIKNMSLKDLKDVNITSELTDGDSLGWEQKEERWVVFSEVG